MLSEYLTKNGVHFGEDYEGFSGQFPAELIILAHSGDMLALTLDQMAWAAPGVPNI